MFPRFLFATLVAAAVAFLLIFLRAAIREWRRNPLLSEKNENQSLTLVMLERTPRDKRAA